MYKLYYSKPDNSSGVNVQITLTNLTLFTYMWNQCTNYTLANTTIFPLKIWILYSSCLYFPESLWWLLCCLQKTGSDKRSLTSEVWNHRWAPVASASTACSGCHWDMLLETAEVHKPKWYLLHMKPADLWGHEADSDCLYNIQYTAYIKSTLNLSQLLSVSYTLLMNPSLNLISRTDLQSMFQFKHI